LTPPVAFFDLTLDDLTAHMADWGEPAYRARQVWSAAYTRLIDDPAAMTDLPASLRSRLTDGFAFSSLTPKATARSKDGGTEKALLTLSDGQAVEAVLMRYERRRTACISTQVGCAMGCVFCATGQMGFVRQLTAGEIVSQVLYFARRLAAGGERLTNLVIMGMGEPFHNYEATMAAIDRLNDPDGFKFGARRITVSTVGLVPMIERFANEDRQVNLAVSLHAATNELRSRLLPINRRYPLEVLFPACRTYVEATGRRITFEWALIEGVNDGDDQARALARLAEGMICHVNLIPLNPTHGYSGAPTSRQRAAAFKNALEAEGIPATVRLRRGIEIEAGCGQLATEQRAAGLVSPA
jgi:23S rRNA (adenine2503-C2)-methyltransferase